MSRQLSRNPRPALSAREEEIGTLLYSALVAAEQRIQPDRSIAQLSCLSSPITPVAARPRRLNAGVMPLLLPINVYVAFVLPAVGPLRYEVVGAD